MEDPIKMDDLGGKPTIFGNIHSSIRLSHGKNPSNRPQPWPVPWWTVDTISAGVFLGLPTFSFRLQYTNFTLGVSLGMERTVHHGGFQHSHRSRVGTDAKSGPQRRLPALLIVSERKKEIGNWRTFFWLAVGFGREHDEIFPTRCWNGGAATGFLDLIPATRSWIHSWQRRQWRPVSGNRWTALPRQPRHYRYFGDGNASRCLAPS